MTEKGTFQREKGFLVFVSQVVEIQAPDKGKRFVDLSFLAEQVMILCKKTVEKQAPPRKRSRKRSMKKDESVHAVYS